MAQYARPSSRSWHAWGWAVGALCCLAPVARAAVTAPFEGANLLAGENVTVTWDPLDGCSRVDIELYRGTLFACTIASDVPDDGSYEWTVDMCGMPACDLSVRVFCPGGGEETYSRQFAVSGLMLERVVPRNRNVTLEWTRLDQDTLGAGNAMTRAPTDSTPGVPRVFGGYNVWRRTFDNQLDTSITESFSKIRTYDVRQFGTDTIPTAWNFPRAVQQYGEVLVEIDEKTSEVQSWVVAQSFTTPSGAALDVCNVRVFNGPLFRRWLVRVSITPLVGQVPDLENALASVEVEVGSNDVNSRTSFLWREYTFESPVTLTPSTQYAIVFEAGLTSMPPNRREPIITWVVTIYDSFEGGSAYLSTDDSATWSQLEGTDYAFVLGAIDGSPLQGAACRDALGQRRGGAERRAFNDPDGILAFERGEDGVLVPLHPTGPFNGFELEYAVTAFERVRLSSGNIELASPCEDTLFTAGGFPLGQQPRAQAVWPELVFPQSQIQTGPPLLREVYPVPNPYVRDPASPSFPRWERPGERRIDFVNLPEGARIRIYTLAGDFVRSFQHTASHGSATWDLRNESGEIVTSGAYIWMVTTDTGETKRGQLVIVR